MESSSAAAFVEGGMQDASEDLCSICLELFSDSNPITVTTCKHGYHLQCILEWAQRSKECPMCWKLLTLEDSSSQELLDAIELERSTMSFSLRRQSRGGLEFHQGSIFLSEADFEERILQHIAEAARAHHFSRRDPMRRRGLTTRDQPQRVPIPHSLISSAVGPDGDFSLSASREHLTMHTNSRNQGTAFNTSRTDAGRTDRVSSGTMLVDEDRQKSTLSEIFSIPESVKSRFAAATLRYKETLTRTTKDLKDMLSTQSTDIGARARDMSAGVSRVLERFSAESSGKKRKDEDVSDIQDGNGCESSGTSSGGIAGENVGLNLDLPIEGDEGAVTPNTASKHALC